MILTDILMIMSTALSPLIAIQVTRYLADRDEETKRKLHIFKILMSTRAYSLSLAHVQALNTIDLEFSSKKPKEKIVLDIWQEYLDHLGLKDMKPEIWNVKRIDLLVELLYAMGNVLNYKFNKIQIKNGAYLPTSHSTQEEEANKIRQMVVQTLEGKRVLPMLITNFPRENNLQNDT